MIEARISSVLDGRQSGDCPRGKGEPPKRLFLPKGDLWDAGRICCGLSHQWSAIGSVYIRYC